MKNKKLNKEKLKEIKETFSIVAGSEKRVAGEVGGSKFKVFQIKALKSIPKFNIKVGDLGGYVTSLDVFSDSESWVDVNSTVIKTVLPRRCKLVNSNLFLVQGDLDERSTVIILHSNIKKTKLYIGNNNTILFNKVDILDSELSFITPLKLSNVRLIENTVIKSTYLYSYGNLKIIRSNLLHSNISGKHNYSGSGISNISIKAAHLDKTCIDGDNIVVGSFSSKIASVFIENCRIHSETFILNYSTDLNIQLDKCQLIKSTVLLERDSKTSIVLNMIDSNNFSNTNSLIINGGLIKNSQDTLIVQLPKSTFSGLTSFSYKLFYRSIHDYSEIRSNTSLVENIGCKLDEYDAMLDLILQGKISVSDIEGKLNLFEITKQNAVEDLSGDEELFRRISIIERNSKPDDLSENLNKTIKSYRSHLNYVRTYFDKPRDVLKVDRFKKLYLDLSMNKPRKPKSNLPTTTDQLQADFFKSMLGCGLGWINGFNNSITNKKPSKLELTKPSEGSKQHAKSTISYRDEILIKAKYISDSIWFIDTYLGKANKKIINTKRNSYSLDNFDILPNTNEFSNLVGTSTDYKKELDFKIIIKFE